MAIPNLDILNNLKAFPPASVYFMAPKDTIIRGYDYYTRERVASLSWNNEGTSLVASVMGTKRYIVELFLEQDQLRSHCTCPAWTPATPCKHAICTILTTINLLSPAAFRIPNHHPQRLEALRACLVDTPPDQTGSTSPKATTGRYELVIDTRDMFPMLSVRKDGNRLQSSWHVPTELAPFCSTQFHVYSLASDQFSTYLKKYGNAHPLVLVTSQGEYSLTWAPSCSYQTKTRLDISGSTATLTALCLQNGQPREHLHSFWHFIADVESGTLAPLEETHGWKLYRRLSLLFNRLNDSTTPPQDVVGLRSNQDPFSPPWETEDYWSSRKTLKALSCQLPLSQFSKIQFTIPVKERDRLLRDTLFSIEGRPAPPIREDRVPGHISPRYRLSLEPRSTPLSLATPSIPSYSLKAECLWGTHITTPSLSAFQFFPALEQNRSLPAALRAQKRKNVLYEAFFQLATLHIQSEIGKVIKRALSGKDFGSRQIQSSAKSFLQHYGTSLIEPEVRLTYTKGQWAIHSTDKSQEALLYQIPFTIFGAQIFRGMTRHHDMAIPSDLLHAHLPQLYATLAEAGIELTYHHKPIKQGSWNFSFDARRKPGIDWFEIRPEITVEGKVLDETTWGKAIRGGGMVEIDGALQILDAPSQEILRSLSGIYPPAKSTKGPKKAITRIPRLQLLDWVALRKHGVQVRLSEEDEALIEHLTHFESIPMPPIPQGLTATLRPYQREGYAWLAFLYQHRLGACLADDMGLGKTLQAISLLGGIHEKILTPPAPLQAPHLVIVPPSLLFNWEQEFTRFYPNLRLHWYSGKERTTDFAGYDVVLTTYGLVRRDIARLETIPFHVVIFDEAQAVKNIVAETTGAVRKLKGLFKLVISGTPLENHVGEYYSLIDLCLPGLLGDYDDFKPQIKAGYTPELETLLHRTKPFILRRTKEAILKDLPSKTETDVYLELTTHQKALYKQTVAQIKPAIEEAYRHKTQAQARIIALTAILKLRQLCVSPRLLDASHPHASPKIDFLLDRLKTLMETGHSALVFSQFTSFLDLVEEALNHAHIRYCRLDGSTAVGKRKALVRAFQESTQASVFLLSLKAGGQGLNLTKASYVFHLDPWWNPAVENQASDRTHRIGQTKKVSIIRILMRHTIEEKMMTLKQQKRELYDSIMNTSAQRGSGIHISKQDFDFLLDTIS